MAQCMRVVKSAKAKRKPKSRKEATTTDLRQYQKEFIEAKTTEHQSWIDNDVFDLVDMRRNHVRNYVTGRWVLTVKYDKEGKFQKCKARWVLRGFQDKQKHDQQKDSPASTRPGFRMTCQFAAKKGLNLVHIDLKTAFLQGEWYDQARDVVCQLPPEAGYPPHIGARLKKPAYGMNDAPRRWWNKLDMHLRKYGMIPTRADRCCYVLYTEASGGDRSEPRERPRPQLHEPDACQDAVEFLLDPVTGSPAHGKSVSGIFNLHVDDLFGAGGTDFEERVLKRLRSYFQVGSDAWNDFEFVGQRIRWKIENIDNCDHHYIAVDQEKCITELTEVPLDKGEQDDKLCTPAMHTNFRSVLGMINWLQSRTQFQVCYKFSRSASASASPTILDVKALNKTVRQLKTNPVVLRFWQLRGKLRLVGYPDASYRNNEDKSSQRAQVIFLAEPRERSGPSGDGCGSLVDYESQKIKRTVLSTTVSELYSFMKCFGTCKFLKGLWMDISGEEAEIHMRTDAKHLVTTASSTHLPEQKETIHMISMLRREACSGSIDDLAHVVSQYCLSDALTKASANPDVLMKAVEVGSLPQVDIHPNFRTLMKHKAYLITWYNHYSPKSRSEPYFLDTINLETRERLSSSGSKKIMSAPHSTYAACFLQVYEEPPRDASIMPPPAKKKKAPYVLDLHKREPRERSEQREPRERSEQPEPRERSEQPEEEAAPKKKKTQP